jgi:hypothetical protein
MGLILMAEKGKLLHHQVPLRIPWNANTGTLAYEDLLLLRTTKGHAQIALWFSFRTANTYRKIIQVLKNIRKLNFSDVIEPTESFMLENRHNKCP